MNYNNAIEDIELQQNQLMKARDVHEKVNDMILEFLKIGMLHMIREEYELAYRAYNQIQEIIIVKQFSKKREIMLASKQIDEYMKYQLNRGAKPDMKAMIDFNNNKMTLFSLIEEYSRDIKTALDEIGLLLKSQVEKDLDKTISVENFNTDEDLTSYKKEMLLTVKDVSVLIKNMTPNQVSDVFARLLTYNDKGGMKL